MSQLIDLAGKQIGKLLVLSRAQNKVVAGRSETAWLCRCECGTTKIIIAGHLLRKRRKVLSCGCLVGKTRPLKGKTFGRLAVLEFAGFEYQGKHKIALWRCKCACGTELIVPSQKLRTEKPKVGSCGCARRFDFDHEFNRKTMIRDYRRVAQTKGRTVSISDQEIGRLLDSKCHYCGAAPSNVRTWKNPKRNPYYYNGIDRIDSSKDYVPGNVVPCCAICNLAKRAMPYGVFVEWIKRAGRHQLRQSRKSKPSICAPALF